MTTGNWVRLAIIVVVVTVAILRWTRRRKSTADVAFRETGAGFVGTPEGNRATLTALRDAGGNLTKPTEISFYLYFPSRAVAERAAAMAQTAQLSPTVTESANGDGTWLLLLTGVLTPTQSALDDTSTRLEAVAAEFGGDYDGWEAAVTQ